MNALRDALVEVAGEHIALVEEHLAAAALLAGSTQRAEYLTHRALAFAHQWCALLESPGADASRVTELVDGQTRLSASDGRTITGVDEIATWFTQTANAVKYTAHTITDYQIGEGRSGQVNVSLDFAWQGLTQDRQAMRARTHHEWILVDRAERFPVLRGFHVTLVEPFSPTTNEEALAFLASVSR